MYCSCVTNVLIGLDSSTEYCLRYMKKMKCYCPNLQVVARCLNENLRIFFFIPRMKHIPLLENKRKRQNTTDKDRAEGQKKGELN